MTYAPSMRSTRFLLPGILGLSLLLGSLFSHAQSADPKAGAEQLLGTWTVDLRPTPASPAYLKKLIITSVNEGKLDGNFYDGSPLQAGRTNSSATDTLCFAFFTDPGEVRIKLPAVSWRPAGWKA